MAPRAFPGALHHTVGVGGLGGLQQTAQLGGLLGGVNALAGGVSNELAGLCALPGGSQPHDVTLNAMQVLQVQHAMAAQALVPTWFWHLLKHDALQ